LDENYFSVDVAHPTKKEAISQKIQDPLGWNSQHFIDFVMVDNLAYIKSSFSSSLDDIHRVASSWIGRDVSTTRSFK
jgi:hypothetical protein